MEEQKEHKRRVRYKGTHPRNYNEKYKELNPEKYQGTIEHVIQKGSTPAGMHIPILVEEILDFLKIEPGQNISVYLRETRMKKAAELLSTTKLSVAEAAEQVGYINQSKFASVFKKQFGLSPLEYRRAKTLEKS